MRRVLSLSRPADRLNVSFLAGLLVLSAFYRRVIPGASLVVSIFCLLIAVQIFLSSVKDRGRIIRFVYDLVFPTLSILLIFDSLGRIVHAVNPRDIDVFLIRLDYLLLGGYPTVMLEAIATPLLTDVLQLAYSTYYFLPLTLGIVLIAQKRSEAFDRSLFLIMLCFYLSYVGYILMPALGPRFTMAHLQTKELQGIVVTHPVQELLNRLEGVKRDAFPSGHTGVALTVLYLARRYEKRLFLLFLPCVAALIVSTVYCRYHYVSDVIAGIVLTLITLLIGETYYAFRTKRIRTGS